MEFKCTFKDCGFTFETATQLSRHERKHGQAAVKIKQTDAKKYVCDFLNCGKRFAYSHHLQQHIPVHTGEKQYSCEYEGCSYSSSMKKAVIKHTLVHTGEKPFKCTQKGCKAAYTQNVHLRNHLVRAHDQEDLSRKGTRTFAYVCKRPGCTFRSMVKRDLAKHKLAHSGLRQFTCEMPGCGKTYVLGQHLDRHMRTHTGTKPFRCDVKKCGFETAYSHSLKDHMALHLAKRNKRTAKSKKDNSLKMYECHESGCDYETRHYQTISVHRYHHAGVKPYSCPVEDCEYKSSAHGSVVYHLKKVHPDCEERPIYQRMDPDRRCLFLKDNEVDDAPPVDESLIQRPRQSGQRYTFTKFFTDYTIGVTCSELSVLRDCNGKKQPNFLVEFDGYDLPAISIPKEFLPSYVVDVFVPVEESCDKPVDCDAENGEPPSGANESVHSVVL